MVHPTLLLTSKACKTERGKKRLKGGGGYRAAHSRPIICQFRTVHFLVSILVSGKNLCVIPLCLVIGAGCQVRSENRNNQ